MDGYTWILRNPLRNGSAGATALTKTKQAPKLRAQASISTCLFKCSTLFPLKKCAVHICYQIKCTTPAGWCQFLPLKNESHDTFNSCRFKDMNEACGKRRKGGSLVAILLSLPRRDVIHIFLFAWKMLSAKVVPCISLASKSNFACLLENQSCFGRAHNWADISIIFILL
jgi:hypothetical protein